MTIIYIVAIRQYTILQQNQGNTIAHIWIKWKRNTYLRYQFV